MREHKILVMITIAIFSFLFSAAIAINFISLPKTDLVGAYATTAAQPSTAGSQAAPTQGDVRPAPKYSAISLDGKISSLEDLHGNPVLINVWATWCIPCREEMPALEALYDEFSDEGLQIVGVSVDSHGSENRVKSFIDRMGINYTIWHDPNDKFTRAFKTIGVPESFFINAQG